MKNKVFAVLVLWGVSYSAVAEYRMAHYNPTYFEAAAKVVCERIQTEPLWSEISQKLNALDVIKHEYRKQDLYLGYPATDTLASTAQQVDSILSDMRYSDADALDRYHNQMLYFKILHKCGADLQRTGKIRVSNEILQNISSGNVEECIVQNNQYYDEVMASDDSDAVKESYIASASACKDLFSHTYEAYRFPYQFLFAGGIEKFKEEVDALQNRTPNGETFLQATDQALVTAKVDLEKAIDSKKAKDSKQNAVQAQRNQAKSDTLARINQIKNGNLSAAQNCQEVASALVNSQASNALGGAVISFDSQDVKLRPTSQIYATTASLISFENNIGLTFDTNAASNQEYAFVLRMNAETLWFDQSKITFGKRLYFVGQYVDNDTVSLSRDGRDFNIKTRVYDVMCIAPLQ